MQGGDPLETGALPELVGLLRQQKLSARHRFKTLSPQLRGHLRQGEYAESEIISTTCGSATPPISGRPSGVDVSALSNARQYFLRPRPHTASGRSGGAAAHGRQPLILLAPARLSLHMAIRRTAWRAFVPKRPTERVAEVEEMRSSSAFRNHDLAGVEYSAVPRPHRFANSILIFLSRGLNLSQF